MNDIEIAEWYGRHCIDVLVSPKEATFYISLRQEMPDDTFPKVKTIRSGEALLKGLRIALMERDERVTFVSAGGRVKFRVRDRDENYMDNGTIL